MLSDALIGILIVFAAGGMFVSYKCGARDQREMDIQEFSDMIDVAKNEIEKELEKLEKRE